ncbi:hypothetical protein [Streptomyces chrestomyceticus]|uniref:hypothetical protein n=1 Tax=Streptomyces chrestomyceticus TaxID=68185 RepID=UPI0019D0E7CB|nr:hypothetical protein [Streptomyces chrestomyceticus]
MPAGRSGHRVRPETGAAAPVERLLHGEGDLLARVTVMARITRGLVATACG